MIESDAGTTEADIAWLAGLLEGEGCFLLSNRGNHGRRNVIRVAIEMCDLDVVQRASAVMGLPTLVRSKRRSSDCNWKASYEATANGKDAERVMRMVLPYMGARRRARIEECLAAPNLSHHPKGALT